jgi:two-component system LytT family response regulator
MLNCLVIDDEKKSIKILKWELEKFNKHVEIKNTFTEPLKAIEYLHQNKVDFVFLNIEMPQMDGFEFLTHFEDRDFEVVFVTAYDDYAIKAIKAKAFDYLLKPINFDELKDLIHKMMTNIEQNKIKNLIDDKIQVNVDHHIELINKSNVLYCQGDGNYCHIFLKNGKSYMISKKLKYMESQLNGESFMRIHNSFIVNLNEVVQINKKETMLKLSNGKSIPVSRQKKDMVFDKF